MKRPIKQKKISDYNTFKVFENIYGQTNQQAAYDELEIPVEPKANRMGNLILGLLIILVISLAVHPLLSYTLKTPYPLVVIAEDSMSPNLVNGDLVLSSGIINATQLQVNDIVVYKTIIPPTHLAVRRIIEVNGSKLILRGDAVAAPAIEISANQVVSKIVGNNQRLLKIPLLGKLSGLLAQI